MLQLHDNTIGVTVLSQHFLSSSKEERSMEVDKKMQKREKVSARMIFIL